MNDTVQTIVKALTNIRDYLDDTSNSKLFHECDNLKSHITKSVLSAMTAYRLQKIAKLDRSLSHSNKSHLKNEINELIHILTHLVSWHCKVCNKIIETEHKNKLTLWIMAHEISVNHKMNIGKVKK